MNENIYIASTTFAFDVGEVCFLTVTRFQKKKKKRKWFKYREKIIRRAQKKVFHNMHNG